MTVTKLIDAPRRQYVALPVNLTNKPPLPALPAPAYHDHAKCKAGCYTSGQLQDALDAALATLGKAWDQLDAIARLSDAAVRTNAPPPAH